MSIYVVYRACIWLPILVPALLIAVARAAEVSLARGPLPLELLAYSLLYGGIPYAAVALWATWWVGGRPEADIRWLMYRAPLLVAVFFAAVALIAGLVVGAPGPFAGVAILGAAVTLPTGYAYVGLAVLLRESLVPE